MMMFLRFAMLMAFLPVPTAFAQETVNNVPFAKIVRPISLGLPIDCTLGEDCFVINYVDMGPEDGTKTDIACNARTYDAHKGTDIAVLDEQAMKGGVNVLAAAAGTVTKVRDGEPDQWATPEMIDKIKEARKECGNAIMIDHGEGLQTLYCHLKNGSVVVQPNQEVKKSDVIAQVGLSGMTEFPHVHLGIIKDKKIIDPFTAKNNSEKCGLRNTPLWDKNLNVQYQQFFISAVGFKDDVPTLKGVERDTSSPKNLSMNSDILTFWMHYYGAEKGDIITMEIKDVNGKTYIEREIEQDKNRASQFYFAGRRTRSAPLVEGVYTGTVKVTRQGKNGNDVIKDKSIPILITP